MAVYSRIEQMIGNKYEIIVADPPWLFKNRSKKGEGKNPNQHYSCMALDQIQKLPVNALAAKNCLLWLWTTNPMLPQGLKTLEAWGFNYVTSGHWAKWNPKTGKQGFGTGYVLRGAGEPFLIGKIGKPPTMDRTIRSVIMAPARGHSVKPEETYDMARRMVGPDGRCLDMFSRLERPGWDQMGDEVERINEDQPLAASA